MIRKLINKTIEIMCIKRFTTQMAQIKASSIPTRMNAYCVYFRMLFLLIHTVHINIIT